MARQTVGRREELREGRTENRSARELAVGRVYRKLRDGAVGAPGGHGDVEPSRGPQSHSLSSCSVASSSEELQKRQQ